MPIGTIDVVKQEQITKKYFNKTGRLKKKSISCSYNDTRHEILISTENYGKRMLIS